MVSTYFLESPGEGFATVGADVGLFHTALMGTHMVAHAVLPLEALLADGTGERLLIRVGQAVAVEMVNIAESLPARLTGVVLSYRIWVGICGALRQNRQADKHTTEFTFGSVFSTELLLQTPKGMYCVNLLPYSFVKTMQRHAVCTTYAGRHLCKTQTTVFNVRLITCYWTLCYREHAGERWGASSTCFTNWWPVPNTRVEFWFLNQLLYVGVFVKKLHSGKLM